MAGQASGNRGQNVTENFGKLLTPVGDWAADLFVFTRLSTEPVHRTGRVTSRMLIGGAGILAMFQIPSSGAQFAALVTFNPRTDLYELALIDANSDMGLGVLVSEPLNQRAPVDVRVRFGKTATEIRSWTVAETTPSLGGTAIDMISAILPVAAQEEGLTEGAPGASQASIRISEILVNPDRWILRFFLTIAQSEFLAAEMVCTRLQEGCLPQLGCELGCAGVPGCARGCEGFQPPNGMPQGQAPLSQAQLNQVLVQAQCGGQTALVGQTQVLGQTQLVGQTQCGCQAQPVCLTTPVCVAPPMQLQPCPMQPVPAPQPIRTEQPGHPGHPKHPK